MTGLERQLTAALERFSAQCETERRRQSGQGEAVRRRVEVLHHQLERLNERVTNLTEYYETWK